MNRITLLLVAVVILAGIVALTAPASLRADDSAAPIYVTKIPPGYRDWRLISVSHEAGNLNSIGAVLGNDVAIKAYREGKLPYPTAPSLPLCTIVTSRRRKTTKSLAKPNLSSLEPPRTSSSWSKTPQSTPRRAAGGSLPS
jgi:hypothetical protein